MAWRTVELGDTLWSVTAAAERRANNASWHLVFSFRTIGPKPVSLWATYPVYWFSYVAAEWNRKRAHEAAAARCRVIDTYHVDGPVDRRAA